MDIIKKFHSAITHKSAMLKFFMIGSRVGKMITGSRAVESKIALLKPISLSLLLS
jgi:hypothetical protein